MRLFICKERGYEEYAIVSVGGAADKPVGDGGERETAKAKAARYLAGDPDNYIVQPLTHHGAAIHFDVSMSHGAVVPRSKIEEVAT